MQGEVRWWLDMQGEVCRKVKERGVEMIGKGREMEEVWSGGGERWRRCGVGEERDGGRIYNSSR